MTREEWLKLFVRRVIAALLFYSGINALYRFLVVRNQAIVLMYHRVVDSAELTGSYVQSGIYVTCKVFEKQMQYLHKRYQVMPLAELIEAVQQRKHLRRSICVITFDDGWKDNHTHALPILKKYNLPATVFLVSDYVGTSRRFWTDEVWYLLSQYFQHEQVNESVLSIYPTLNRLGVGSVISRPGWAPGQKIEAIVELIKDLQEAERDKAVKELKNLARDDSVGQHSKPLLLSWDQVGEMQKAGVTFGSHTRTHRILTKTSEEEAREEIVGSKLEIESRLSTACWAFCYPNGDYNHQVQQMVREHYRCAFTTERMFVRPGSDRFSLGRIAIHNDMSCTRPLFACRLSGILNALGL